MKMYVQEADGTVTKTTTMNNSQMVLGSIGMLGGLYYAFTTKKSFLGYVGFALLGSIAGGLVGNILGGVSKTTTSVTPPTENMPIPTPSKQVSEELFSMDSVSAIC